MQQSNFYKEQSDTLKMFLNECIYPQLKLPFSGCCGIELILTPDCNKNCKYCYLQKHKHELFPEGTNNLKTILNNLNIFLNYLLKNNIQTSAIDLYAGEIWDSKFAYDVFDCIIKYIDKGLKISSILIPSNGSFIYNKKALEKIETYIENFNDRDVKLLFSISYDGILDVENRPYTSTPLEEQNPDELFQFVKKYGYGFHPMVSAYKIEKWVDNHYYWKKKMKEYSMKLGKAVMFLEVRDGDTWTDEAIEFYLQWLQVFAKDIIHDELSNDPLNALEHILRTSDDDNQYGFMPFFQHVEHNETHCSLTQQLVIRLGDLSIVPCHRLCYDKFIYGKFIVENNEIVDIEGKNVNFMYSNLLMGGSGSLKCDTCPFSRYCIKQCRGACFEHHKEALYPIEDVCHLEICKILFSLNLIMDLKEKVSIDQLSVEAKLRIKKVEQFLNDIKINRKEYLKWINLTEKYRLKF